MNQEYRELSTIYYNLTKPVGYSIEGDIEYYTRSLKDFAGLVLEAGVGTGRVLIPLLKQDVKIEGVDSSAEMLERCRINLKKHGLEAVLYEQDIMNLDLPKKYDAIIIPAGSFCILPKDKVEVALRNLYHHLNEGGKLIIDLEMPSSFQEGQTAISKVPISEEKLIKLTSYSDKIDRRLQRISYINKYELIEKDKVLKTEGAEFILYWYETQEFAQRLSMEGYQNIRFCQGYGHKESDIITFTAEK